MSDEIFDGMYDRGYGVSEAPAVDVYDVVDDLYRAYEIEADYGTVVEMVTMHFSGLGADEDEIRATALSIAKSLGSVSGTAEPDYETGAVLTSGLLGDGSSGDANWDRIFRVGEARRKGGLILPHMDHREAATEAWALAAEDGVQLETDEDAIRYLRRAEGRYRHRKSDAIAIGLPGDPGLDLSMPGTPESDAGGVIPDWLEAAGVSMDKSLKENRAAWLTTLSDAEVAGADHCSLRMRAKELLGRGKDVEFVALALNISTRRLKNVL